MYTPTYVMQNGAKITGMFTTEAVIPDAKMKAIKERLTNELASMTNSRVTDPSKPAQAIILDQGAEYKKLDMLSIQDADLAKLKDQTTKRICALYGVPPQMLGLADGKFNNVQSLTDEFYKTGIYPSLVNIQQNLNKHLLKGYSRLCFQFDANEFLRGDLTAQMNWAVAGVGAGILSANEARGYLGLPNHEQEDANDLMASKSDPMGMPGQSPQFTGGGAPKNKPNAKA